MKPKKRRYLAMAARTIAVHTQYDRALETHEQPPTPVQCKRGCSACCYQFTGVILPEAALIYARHAPLVDGLLEVLFAHSNLLQQILTRLGKDPQTPGADIMEDREAIANEWWKEQVGCPFLDVEKRECQIYESRPIACRTYHVLSDPALCGEESPVEVTGWRPMLMDVTEKIVRAQGNDEVTVGGMAEMMLYARREMRR